MNIIRLILLSITVAFIIVFVIYNAAIAQGGPYAAFICINPDNKTELAIERAYCDQDSEALSFKHGLLRRLTPQDPVNPDTMGCRYPEVGYVCVGEPPENPPAQSYIWTSGGS
jgi:hypothetical protein